MRKTVISIQGYRIKVVARRPENIQKPTTLSAARFALLKELGFDLAAVSEEEGATMAQANMAQANYGRSRVPAPGASWL